MKIVCILGEPRPEGSSIALAHRFLEAAKGHDAEVEIVPLGKLDFSRCRGCDYCKALGKCVGTDDMAQVLDSVCKADILVLASPVAYGEVTKELKDFISRTYSFVEPDFMTNPNPSRLKPGKKLVFILTQGESDEKLFADIPSRYDNFFRWCGFVDSRVIRACGVVESDEVLEREDVLQLAEDTARQLVA